MTITDLAEAYLALIGILQIIVRITPTKADDNLLRSAVAWISQADRNILTLQSPSASSDIKD